MRHFSSSPFTNAPNFSGDPAAGSAPSSTMRDSIAFSPMISLVALLGTATATSVPRLPPAPGLFSMKRIFTGLAGYCTAAASETVAIASAPRNIEQFI